MFKPCASCKTKQLCKREGKCRLKAKGPKRKPRRGY